ncbi:MAG: glycosyltransferase family 2 protein [Magnetovibrionaceae bacterium]
MTEPTVSATPEPRLSVVVPVKDEIDNVGPLISEICAALRGLVGFEIVYVDDGSSDGTTEKLQALTQEVPELRVYRHRVCCGQSAAIWTGVKRARGQLIATLDGDGQNDPADIPKLLERYDAEGGGDALLIAGWRTTRKDTSIRRFSSKLANGIRSGLLRDATPDTGCGLKVYSREAFLTLPRFDHMHRFMPALMMRLGGRVISVPVNHRPRERGTSKYGVWNRLWVGIVDLFGVSWLIARGSKPQVEDIPGPDGRTS